MNTRSVLLFPVTRFLVALSVIAVAFIARDVVANGILQLHKDAVVVRAVVTLFTVLAGYMIYVRLVERRRVWELAPRHALRELALGIVIGTGVISLVVGVLWLAGSYRVAGVGSWGILLAPLLAVASRAMWEEIVFRGVLFRMLEEGLGTWIALGASAAAFGLLHLGNPNVSLFGIVTIAAVAGGFLAGTYVLTRRLWLAIGTHYAVNVTQGPLFGLPVSGRERSGVLDGQLEGPQLLTGGAFGLEASVLMALVGAVLAVGVVWWAHRLGRFVPPMWRRPGGASEGGILPALREGADSAGRILRRSNAMTGSDAAESVESRK